MIAFTGRAQRLTDAGVAAAAQSIGTTPRLLRTVMAVETAGRGYDPQGRVRMLFEPGTFFHRVPEAKRDAACRAGCALVSMAGHHYPNDSYPLLEAAMKIDSSAALESASWGLPQIMGFNHGLAGYVSAEAMIADFVDSEDLHVMALAKFLKASRLVDALNAHRWADVARGYNGLGYERNAYDTKLATAYAAIRDATAVAVATAVPPRVPTPVLDSITHAISAHAAEAGVVPKAVAVSAAVPTAAPAHIDAAKAQPLTGWRAVLASVRAHFGQAT